jgi:aryl-alcohol dehydrogenase-like predicted oxidoreductase
MHNRLLGSSGRAVGAVGLGAMPLSLARRPDEARAIRVIHAALEAGMTLIDTADSYCLDDSETGHNERIILQALRDWPRRDEVLVATKGGLERPGGAWVTNGRPEHLRAACDRSLKALGVDRIELYQLHSPDPAVPFLESVGALAELQRAGKIRHLGLSNVSVEHIELARTVVRVISVQNRCNPFERESFFDGTVAYCSRNHIAFLAHSPVGGHRGHVRVTTEPTLRRVAQRVGATPYQVTLAWLLASSPMMIPIPGASRIESAKSSAAAAELALPPAALETLNAAFPIAPR